MVASNAFVILCYSCGPETFVKTTIRSLQHWYIELTIVSSTPKSPGKRGGVSVKVIRDAHLVTATIVEYAANCLFRMFAEKYGFGRSFLAKIVPLK